jgi:hypothetical protein
MDGEGLLKRQTFNEAASKCLGRIKLNWGNKRGGDYAHLGGYYIVFCVKNFYEEDDEYISMPDDMTPRRFIHLFNEDIIGRFS